MILVTGASGSLGSEICRQLPSKHVLALDIDEYGLWRLANELGVKTICDSITRAKLWDTLERDYEISNVINCAAVKHVFTVENHDTWARMVNEFALNNMICRRWKLTHVSTDKAVLPVNKYGLYKLNAEHIVAPYGNVVRLVNIHNSRGCAEEIFKNQIIAGGPVKVRDHRMKRYYTTVEQAASDVIAVSKNANNGTFMPEHGKAVLIDDIIADLIRLYGRNGVDVECVGVGPEEKLIEDLYTPYEKLEPVAWSNRIYEVVRNG